MKRTPVRKVCVVLSCVLLFACGARAEERIREAAFAGSWYPADVQKLCQMLDGFLAKADVEVEGDVVALISPHAGYVYSGQAMAYGFKLLRGRDISRVILIGPSHRVSFRGVCVSSATHYETPLGKVPVDINVCEALLKEKLFIQVPGVEEREHSLELQLPMLQRVLSDFRIVPLIVGELDRGDYDSIAGAIRKHVDDKTIVVASSDFTHYGARFGYVPFEDDIDENLRKLDMGVVERILEKDFEGYMDYLEDTGATVCGAKPIGILLKILSEEVEGRLLKYYTSRSLEGAHRDTTGSVSYVSLAFYRGGGDELDEQERQTLLMIARDTLRTYLSTGKLPDVEAGKYRITEKMRRRSGVFVSLKKRSELRGCIGDLFGEKPLYQGVVDNTVNAATRDPRFRPMTAEEEPEVEIEISVLSPFRKIESVNEIEVGKHGLFIKKGPRRGVLLPQVPVEWGWDRDEFLAQICKKAGLPPDAWKDRDAEIFIFSAQVFGEKKR